MTASADRLQILLIVFSPIYYRNDVIDLCCLCDPSCRQAHLTQVFVALHHTVAKATPWSTASSRSLSRPPRFMQMFVRFAVTMRLCCLTRASRGTAWSRWFARHMSVFIAQIFYLLHYSLDHNSTLSRSALHCIITCSALAMYSAHVVFRSGSTSGSVHTCGTGSRRYLTTSVLQHPLNHSGIDASVSTAADLLQLLGQLGSGSSG